MRWTAALCGFIATTWPTAVESKVKGHCTAILVGAKASAHGTPMTTHSNDCPSCDFRLAKIPPQTHPIGSQRDVYVFSPDYPRYVGTTRGPAYDPALVDRRFFNWTDTTPIAQIPQVQSTYGYIEGVYPIMNDHRVAMGESTCAAKFVSKPVSGGGRARLDIVELGRLALERTTCARDAIALMGGMAETHGYYGSFWGTPSAFENAGEALTVTDPTEAWMLHMLPDDTGASAIWVAQRVHDNHVAAVANRFVIREINFTDTDHFMASANVLDIAKRHGFWDGVAPFDFTDAYAGPPDMTLSSSLRVGRVLSLANKNVNVDTFADTTPFFSAKADTLLTVQDVMRFQRDHYEGTKFDLTKGPASGPYGDPNRYEIADADVGTGHFERAIGIYEATYTFVSVLDATNRYNDHIWFGPYSPDSTIYTPVYALATAIPATLRHGSLREFDMHSAFWINALIGNYASKWYAFAHPVVSACQIQTETYALELQNTIHAKANEIAQTENPALLGEFLTNATDTFAQTTHLASTALFTALVTTFHDGVIMSNLTDEHLVATSMSMPRWWLELVGFYPPTTVGLSAQNCAPLAFQGAVIAMCAGLVGFLLGRQSHVQRKYLPIN